MHTYICSYRARSFRATKLLQHVPHDLDLGLRVHEHAVLESIWEPVTPRVGLSHSANILNIESDADFCGL